MSNKIILSQIPHDGDKAVTNMIKYKDYKIAMTERINKDKYQIKFYNDHDYNKKEKLEFSKKEFEEFINKNNEN